MEYVKEYWGITEYYKNGVLHRDGDLPAVITVHGHMEYWKTGNVTGIMVQPLYEKTECAHGIKTVYI